MQKMVLIQSLEFICSVGFAAYSFHKGKEKRRIAQVTAGFVYG